MRSILFILPAIAILFGCKRGTLSNNQAPQSPGFTQYVNPFIGTGGHGHTYPGATLPFGMVQLSPDTRLEGWDGCSGYHFSDSVLYGFSHTHLSGTGVSDYGDILIMADTGMHWQQRVDYAAPFSKSSEQASPGYYKVELKDRPVKAEMTTSVHAGLHRYAFPANAHPLLLLDLNHRDPVIQSGIKVVGDRQVEGFRISNAWAKAQHVYFVAEFSRPFESYLVDRMDAKVRTMEGKDVFAQFRFAPSPEPLMVKVGISGVDVEGARKNLEKEISSFDFEGVRSIATETWEKALSKIRVKGGSETQKTIFYSALYHTMIVPNEWSDLDGRYRGMDGKIHRLETGDKQYTVFSLWDTFRATHPLYTILEQERTAAFIRTFIRQYQQSGLLPVWELAANETNCMIGYHSVSVIADAYLKGIQGFNADTALTAMVKSAMQDHLGLEAYKRQGFIGAEDEAESVSKALEYAYDDWTIAQMARKLGRKDIAEEFESRAMNYRNHFDPDTRFFRARRNGGWMEGFDPREVNFNFTEANAWQYSLFAPQDIGGLMTLHGGEKSFEEHLDKLFSADSRTTGRDQADITGLIGQYAHGNEPSHHMAYLYTYCRAPHKTQKLVRQILDSLYFAAPDGLSGNEDCGQMSAWLVMSAMGFYPVVPGSPYYTLGSPWFDEIEIQLENGNTFTISAPGNQSTTPYVQQVRLNGKTHPRPWISHAEVLAGGRLEFTMGTQPKSDAYAIYDFPDLEAPYARILPSPYAVAASETFFDSHEVTLKPLNTNHQIYYRLLGGEWKTYNGPLKLLGTTHLEFKSQDKEGNESRPVRASFYKVDQRRSITLNSTFANQYAAGGPNAMIDQLRGGTNFRTGRWQGYPRDFEATVDLGSVQQVEYVGLGCLQDIGSWIWMPNTVSFSFSEDGKTYSQEIALGHSVSDSDYNNSITEIGHHLPAPRPARYVRVKAVNYGKCPDWHLGAGGNAWIFVDEIVVK